MVELTGTRFTPLGTGICTGPDSSLCKGVAHFSGGIVGEVANRIDSLHRRTGSHQHLQAVQILFGAEKGADGFHDFGRFAHASVAAVAAGEESTAGANGLYAALKERAQIALRGLRCPHSGVHSGGQKDGRFGGKQSGGEHIVGDAVSQLCHDVGRRRSHDHHIGFLGERNMLDIP